MIGSTDQANHQYDLTDFDTALANNNLPSVSFLKASAFEDAHPSNSDPLDEQRFVARTINALEQSPEWSSTAVILAYDDSDGWYDHQMGPIVSTSNDPANDKLNTINGAGACGNVKGTPTIMDRCGFGPRLPLQVISPYAKQNYVDHSLTDQTSVLRFIEDNWNLGRIDTHNLTVPAGVPTPAPLRTDGAVSMDSKAGSLLGMFDFSAGAKQAPKVYLDPNTGEVVKTPPSGTVSGNPVGTPTPTPTATVTSTSESTSVSGTVDNGNTDDLPVTDTLSSTKTNAVTTAGKPAKVTLTCSTKGSGKKIAVSCTAKGADAGSKLAVRFRIAKGATVLGTKATTLAKGKAKATVKVSRSLKKGAKYTLRVSVASKGGVIGLNKTFKV
jgi:phospholipase C